MKKLIIGLIASIVVRHSIKREWIIMMYKIYNHVSYELNARPKESLRALQNVNKDFKKNQQKYGEQLARGYKFNLKKFFTDLFTAELQKILAEPKDGPQKVAAMGPTLGPPPVVNQFIHGGPPPGAAGSSMIKNSIAQGAINIYNEQNPHNPISDLDVIRTRKAMQDRQKDR